MPKFSYEVIDYNKETSTLSVSIKTSDPKVANKQELIHFECPLDNDGKVVLSQVQDVIRNLIQNTYWASWNYQNTPVDAPVGINTVIGATYEQEYGPSKRIWTPPAPPPAPEDDLVTGPEWDSWSWLNSEEFEEWSDIKNRINSLEEKSE